MEASSEVAARVLVVAYKTAATQPLLDAVHERAQRGKATFTLLVPNPAPACTRSSTPRTKEPARPRESSSEPCPR
jgi:hypothetical protein